MNALNAPVITDQGKAADIRRGRHHLGMLLNLPGAAISVPTITEKDAVDLAFGQEVGVDYVALSFVRNPEDVFQARRCATAGAAAGEAWGARR